jgi:predicted HAD superfamily Cof-like phosphohydrolase
MNVFEALKEFHDKFHMRVRRRGDPGFFNEHLFKVRTDFMCEELDEYIFASVEKHLPNALDGLIDLLYVVVGTIDLHGWTPEQAAEAFRRVHEANMKKVLVRSERESKRRTLYDVKKPAGWVAPDLEDLCK